MAYTRASGLGACCTSCAQGGSCLGDVNVATGIDTSVRPGESVYEYMERIAREQLAYQQFLQTKPVASPLPPGTKSTTPTTPPPTAGMSGTTKIAILGAVAVVAFLITRKKR